MLSPTSPCRAPASFAAAPSPTKKAQKYALNAASTSRGRACTPWPRKAADSMPFRSASPTGRRCYTAPRNSPYATLIRTAKYYSRPDCGRSLGSMYARELMADAPEIARHIDVLLPVGMHWLKQLRRGYNQSREIAEGMGSVLGIAVGDNLTAVRGHATQTRRTADERRKNLKGIFAISHPEEIRGLNVAVVDDVITSGTTAAEAARAVLDAGAATASIFALGLTNS